MKTQWQLGVGGSNVTASGAEHGGGCHCGGRESQEVNHCTIENNVR